MSFTAEQKKWAERMDAGSACLFSKQILWAYKFRYLRRICIAILLRTEGGRFFSATLREILRKFHGVNVGRYSYGPCLDPGDMPPGTVVGAYCSLAPGITIHRRNKPLDRLTMHPFFYNRFLGLVPEDTIANIEDNPLTIGNDVWIGNGATILPGCRTIGDGAVIGAASIVNKDVEPYTVVVGSPAKTVRRRFSEEVEKLVCDSRWWELSLSELLEAGDVLITTIGDANRGMIQALKRQKSEQ